MLHYEHQTQILIFMNGLKYCIALLFCFISVVAKTQTTHNLDLTQGISIFKLGSGKGAIKNLEIDTTQIQFFKSQSTYKYLGDSLSTIFNIKVSKINLTYYKDKLYQMTLIFGSKANPYTLSEYEQIKNALEAEYGKNSKKLAMTGVKLIDGNRWEGETVLLDHVRYGYTGTKKKKLIVIEGSISFTDRTLSKQIAANKDFL
jgi:hypothetical protein